VWSIIQSAGWPIWPLIFTSVLTLAIIFERLWALREERVWPENLLEETLSTTQKARSVEQCTEMAEQSLLGLVLAGGLACRHRDRTHLREALEVAGRKAESALEKNLSVLSMIVTIAPLMGLLGTVVGMIEVFGSQSSIGADPTALAHGISTALYNTAFGLIIAIPAAIAHRYFRINTQDILGRLEDAGRALLEKIAITPQRALPSAPPPGVSAARPPVSLGSSLNRPAV
jgi:biopolymer transport protein ExbB